MRIIILLLIFLTTGLLEAKSIDINTRGVISHKQVTTCDGDFCTINTVTHFDKSKETPENYIGDCVFNEVNGIRTSRCDTNTGIVRKEVPVIELVEITNTVVLEKDTAKDNRIQIHAGYGANGLETFRTYNETRVQVRRGVIFGAQYTRRLNQDFNAGITVFSANNITITFGHDF